MNDGRTQQVLFPETDLFNPEPVDLTENLVSETKVIKLGSVVCLRSSDGKEINIACGINMSDVQSLKADSGFVKALLGKSVGDEIKFGNGFEVIKIE